MKKYCVFNSKKICDNCGECDRCDLDPNKKCDNCGKCLEMQGIDTKAIKIQSVIEDKKNAKIYQDAVAEEGFNKIDELLKQEEKNESESSVEPLVEDEYTNPDFDKENEDISNDEDVKMEYIEDVDGLKEILKNEEKIKSIATEQFPGFFVIDKESK